MTAKSLIRLLRNNYLGNSGKAVIKTYCPEFRITIFVSKKYPLHLLQLMETDIREFFPAGFRVVMCGTLSWYHNIFRRIEIVDR